MREALSHPNRTRASILQNRPSVKRVCDRDGLQWDDGHLMRNAMEQTHRGLQGNERPREQKRLVPDAGYSLPEGHSHRRLFPEGHDVIYGSAPSSARRSSSQPGLSRRRDSQSEASAASFDWTQTPAGVATGNDVHWMKYDGSLFVPDHRRWRPGLFSPMPAENPVTHRWMVGTDPDRRPKGSGSGTRVPSTCSHSGSLPSGGGGRQQISRAGSQADLGSEGSRRGSTKGSATARELRAPQLLPGTPRSQADGARTSTGRPKTAREMRPSDTPSFAPRCFADDVLSLASSLPKSARGARPSDTSSRPGSARGARPMDASPRALRSQGDDAVSVGSSRQKATLGRRSPFNSVASEASGLTTPRKLSNSSSCPSLRRSLTRGTESSFRDAWLYEERQPEKPYAGYKAPRQKQRAAPLPVTVSCINEVLFEAHADAERHYNKAALERYRGAAGKSTLVDQHDVHGPKVVREPEVTYAVYG